MNFNLIISKDVGVYRIQNLNNNKVYIGGSKNIKNRFYYHKRLLKLGRHDNNHLQNSWNTYGESQFSFEIIEHCSLEIIIEREQFYIDYYKAANRNFGYNIMPCAKHSKLSEETKRKIGEANKGKPNKYKGIPRTEETKRKIAIANTSYGNHMKNKVGVLHHNFGKKHTDLSKIAIGQSKKGKINTKCSKPIIQLDKNGLTVNRYPSIMQAERDTGIQSKNIGKCLNGQRKSAGNFHWEYEV